MGCYVYPQTCFCASLMLTPQLGHGLLAGASHALVPLAHALPALDPHCTAQCWKPPVLSFLGLQRLRGRSLCLWESSAALWPQLRSGRKGSLLPTPRSDLPGALGPGLTVHLTH